MSTSHLTALEGTMPCPRLRPYPPDTNAPCVLASHSSIALSQRVSHREEASS
jgi:hypothetical protein